LSTELLDVILSVFELKICRTGVGRHSLLVSSKI
jgi:hypothetical protein